MTTQQQDAGGAPAAKMFVTARHGAEYNLPDGLDWARIDAEYRERRSQYERVGGEAAAKAMQRGGNGPAARAAGVDAYRRWAEEAGEELPDWLAAASGAKGLGDDDD